MRSGEIFLLKLVVAQFYKQNAGLFLFLFLLFFGIIPPQHLITTHATLIQAQITSPSLMLGVSFFWLLYAGRCIRFIDRQSSEYHHSILHIYQGLAPSQTFRMIGKCFLLMYLPILSYATVTLLIAITQAAHWYSVGTSLLLLFTVILSMIWSQKLLVTSRESNQSAITLQSFSQSQLKKSIGMKFMLLAFLWSDKKIGLLTQKLFTYLSFNFFFIRNAEIFRVDYFTFFIFLIGAINALLIFNCHKLTEEKLSFLRNLPISMTHRILMIVTTGLILFLPELIMMLVSGFKLLTISDSLMLYGLLASQFVLLFSVLYTSALSFKKYVQYIFLILLAYLVTYLLIHPGLIVLANLALAYLIFHEQYHLYEQKVDSL